MALLDATILSLLLSPVLVFLVYLPLKRQAARSASALRVSRENEVRFRALLVQDGIGVGIIDSATGRFLEVNQKYGEIVGRTAGEMTGMTFQELTHPEDLKSDLLNMESLKAGFICQFAMEKRYFHKDGRLVWVRLNVVPLCAPGESCSVHMALVEDISPRKGLEAALRQSEERHRLLIEESPDAIGIFKEGRVVFANAAAAQLFRARRPEELLGRPGQELIAPVDFAASTERVRRLLAGESGRYTAEVHYIRLDGSLVLVEVVASRVLFEQQPAVEFMARDITDRRRAEERLRQREQQLSESQRVAKLGSWSLDLVTGQLDWSDETFKRFDKVPGLFAPTVAFFLGCVHAEDRTEIEEAMRNAVENDAPYLVQARIINEGGREWVMEAMGVVERGENGRALRFMGTAQDVTERVAIENQVRRLSHAVEQSPVSVVITDPSGLIEYVNPKFTAVSGYSFEEVRGKNPRILKGERTSRGEYSHLWKTITSGRQWSGEMHNRKKSGEHYWESVTISPIVDRAGRITQYLALKEDITRRKALEAQLFQAQKLDSIGQLAGGVAHDMNNMLAATMLHLGLLQQHPGLDPATKASLHELLEETKKASNLTRQLLAFSRRSALALRPVDLDLVVDGFLKMLNRLLGENITVQFRRGSGLSTIMADPGMMEQVLMNLAVNARDAMPSGGVLSVGLDSVVLDQAMASTQAGARAGAFVRLSVADTGCGMDEATLERIYEPFFTTKEPGKGTGLGLATVHGIIGQHRGWIEVESRTGHGTEFRVFLPACAGQSATEPPPVSSGRLEGLETILLVEDDVTLRSITARSLRALGYTVLEAQDGSEALKIWRGQTRRVDLLLSDLRLPGELSGLDLARLLRNESPGLRLVIMTGYSTESVGGANPYEEGVRRIQKPFDMEAMARTLRQSLDGTPPGSNERLVVEGK